MPAQLRRFRFVGLLTVVSVYLLILVGGIVRSTGSGMGCPDWPKCFGSWVPPTEVSQLPANYKEIYTAQRVTKNQKLARTLQKLGFAQVAGSIFAHPTQYIETDFNPTKTWIEYLNRLLGALIGVFVFLTVVFALPFWRRDQAVFWLALVSFLLTGVQGYLGSLVVSTNLLPVMVTVHMALALVLVALLLYAVDRAGHYDSPESASGQFPVEAAIAPRQRNGASANSGLRAVLWLTLLATFVQIILGTQVREKVDMIAAVANYLGRESWVAQLGRVFTQHRAFSIVLVLLNAYASYELWQLNQPRLRRLVAGILVVMVAEVLAGFALAYWALPAAVQPVHLTLATVLFGLQFLALLATGRVADTQDESTPQAAARRIVA